MSKKTYSLSALSERLFAEDRLKPLAGKIKRAQDIASLHTDLVVALECMDALISRIARFKADDEDHAITEFALLCTSLIHYARATKTVSDERIGFDLRSRFTPDQKTVHQELVDLRDKAIAHFGSGGSYQGLWHVEVMILQPSDSGVRAGVATRRQTRDKALIGRARKQIETAARIMHEVSVRAVDTVTAELNTLDPDTFETEINQHLVDLNAIMLSDEVGDEIRSSAEGGGYRKGILSHDG